MLTSRPPVGSGALHQLPILLECACPEGSALPPRFLTAEHSPFPASVKLTIPLLVLDFLSPPLPSFYDACHLTDYIFYCLY